MLNIRVRGLLRHLTITALAVILILTVPVILILSLPLVIYKYLVVLSAKAFRPDLKDILSPSSAIFAQHDSLDDPKCSVVLPMVFDGELGIQEFRDAFRTRILEHKTACGKLPYAGFQQCLTDWMGFKFWKEVKDFNIEDHIKVHPDVRTDEVVNEDDLTKLCATLVTKSYDKTRSPWEFLLVPNVQIPSEPGRLHTAIVFRFNHALCDGYSVLKLSILMFQIKVAPVVVPKQKSQKRSLSSSIMFALKFLHKLAEVILLSLDNSLWKIAEDKKTGNCNIQASKILQCKYIKAVKNHQKVAFSSIIYATLTGAIRNISLKKEMKLPEKMPLLMPIPKPGHPGGLVNHL
jgi:hypothetical protein